MGQQGETMRAVVMQSIGRPRVLKNALLPRPQPGPGQVLVKVHAASINAADLDYRSGGLLVRKPMPHILGSDLAGEIELVGAEAGHWRIGDRVCACFDGLGSEFDGGYAEYCLAPADGLVALPGSLTYADAVAAGASFAEAWSALVKHGELRPGESVVVRGAATGIGLAAVQIARAGRARAIAISPAEFALPLREIGADIVLEDAGTDLTRQVKVATDERGASLVLHCGGELRLQESLKMLDAGGRLVIAGAPRKAYARLDVMALYRKNFSLRGACGGLDPREFETLLRALAEGKYQAPIEEILPLSQASRAHRKLERKPVFGKIVLAPDSILAAAKKPDNWIPID